MNLYEVTLGKEAGYWVEATSELGAIGEFLRLAHSGEFGSSTRLNAHSGLIPRVTGFKQREFASEDEWHEYELSRGDLAMSPETLPCSSCTREAGRPNDVMDDSKCIQRRVVSLGPIAEAHRDPTQTYRLACGHTVI